MATEIQRPMEAELSMKMEPAPEHCPGVESENAGAADACQGCPNQSICSAKVPRGPDPDLPAIAEALAPVDHKLLVLSGKGGVGKSTFAAMLGWGLASDPEREVAMLDLDFCGPSLARVVGATGESIHASGQGWTPVYVEDNLGIMSIAFMLPNEDEAVIWRGDKKTGLIKQFLKNTDWASSGGSGKVDYMIIDTPPGTSDEHISINQYLGAAGGFDGAVLITTPQEVALLDVRKEIDFCRKAGIPVLGLVENMAGFVCPRCQTESDIFLRTTGGGPALAKEMNIPFLGSLPLDPRIGQCSDEGLNFVEEYPDSPATTAVLDVVAGLQKQIKSNRA